MRDREREREGERERERERERESNHNKCSRHLTMHSWKIATHFITSMGIYFISLVPKLQRDNAS